MDEFHGQHAALTKAIIGIFYEVMNELGFGFLESVYRRSMLIALRKAGFTVEEEVPVPVYFRGEWVGTFFADLRVNDLIILELKVADQIIDAYEAQVLHYLRSSRVEIGYVLAFGKSAKFKRVHMSNDRKKALMADTNPS